MPAQRYSIVASNHAKAEDFIRTLKGGEELALVREPHNPYDRNAVAVWLGERMIGYVPKTHNVTLAAFIDAKGEPWQLPGGLLEKGKGGFALDASMPNDRAIRARFVRSPNSKFPQAEVA